MSDSQLAKLPTSGMRRWQLTPKIRLTSVQATLADDLELRGEGDAHLSLVIMCEGAGWFRLNRQAIQHYCADSFWLSCASGRCQGYDFFPRHHFYHLLIVDFSPELLALVEECGLRVPGDEPKVFSASLSEPLKAAMLDIQQGWNEASPLAALHLESLALNALWLALGQLQTQQEARPLPAASRLPSRERKRLIAARELIRLQASEPLSIEEMARTAGLSLMAFKRGFRAMFGITPWNYVIECRLKLAQNLLEESALPLSDIALRCGFAHASHLTRFFQRQYGQPPGRYRSSSQQVRMAG
ncbi:AraC family transcriptional regulator [Erwinia sp. SLM-02]|uniref:AraC family transcriptional regulator n=1 Tax=Erwinia sp. SLM-02 TaxID=3020057 RepID=UPI0028D726E5|nr:AraC family transcriptional regulator [uncultured Erwinia sp.]